MSLLNLLSRFGSSAAPATTSYSTLAPVEWQKQVVARPGFDPLGSGGGGVPATMNNGLFGGLFDNFFDTTDANGIKTQGWGGMALSGMQGLGNSYMAMKQYGLAEDALKEQKRQFNTNFEAQRKLTNSQLADRQRARVASNPNAYQSEAEYMKQWGV